jgi:hypothetical protein
MNCPSGDHRGLKRSREPGRVVSWRVFRSRIWMVRGAASFPIRSGVCPSTRLCPSGDHVGSAVLLAVCSSDCKSLPSAITWWMLHAPEVPRAINASREPSGDQWAVKTCRSAGSAEVGRSRPSVRAKAGPQYLPRPAICCRGFALFGALRCRNFARAQTHVSAGEATAPLLL